MLKKYRKKPVTIEAMQFDGTPQSATRIIDWALEEGDTITYTCPTPATGGRLDCRDVNHHLSISTLEGTMQAERGDYIIKGVQGEFYPCKPDIFQQTYEEVAGEDLA